MTARQQAVVGVRERKQREESESLPTTMAATATDPNPIVMLIVCLLAAASVADDRIPFTCRASPQDDVVAVSGPVRFKLVRRGRKWDKENRSSLGLCPWALPPGVDLPRSEPEAELLLLNKSNWKRIKLLGYSF
jgi:hypothetical protein